MRISTIAKEKAGLSIPIAKSAMVRTRLARRLRALGFASYEQYCDFVENAAGASEITDLISALTTNVSHWFREEHHFETFEAEVVPQIRRLLSGGSPVRIWSAGCANGQEPYSIAMVLDRSGVDHSQDVRILATDIDPVVVNRARSGRYDEHFLNSLKPEQLSDYFTESGAGSWDISERLRSLISFKVLNLLETWPMRIQFEAVFCRNVVIYFDKETQSELWARFASFVRPGGYLFLGHSERIDIDAEKYFEKCGVTTYKRTETPAPRFGKAS